MKLFTIAATALLFTSGVSASALTGTGLDLSGAYSQKEGAHGYLVQLNWQFSDYAELSLSGRSHLNSDTFTLQEVMSSEQLKKLEDQAGTAGYTPSAFSPRHNGLSAGVTLRYPLDLSGWSVAPFIDIGSQQMRTKDVKIYAASATGSGGTGTGSGTGSNTQDRVLATLSFNKFDALTAGVGLQIGTGTHQWRMGYHTYATDSSWSDLQILDDQSGGWLRYDYFVSEHLAVLFQFDSVDAFGDPTFDLGLRWRF